MSIEIILLSVAVLAIAFVYGSVGLGGGSSYTALFTIVGFSYTLIPTLSLSLNTIVTLVAVWQFGRKGHLKMRLLLPFIATSVPFAYLGGRLDLPESIFQVVLLFSLVAVAFRIYLWKDPVLRLPNSVSFKWALSLGIGSLLGFIAGSVGIGGGIYLVPIILITGLGNPKEAAATGAGFILFNSVTGLLARAGSASIEWDVIWPLGLAVFVGGWAGSHLGAGKWESRVIQQVLGAIIVLAIISLARTIFL